MTNAAVLVLNKHWQPVNVTSVRRAFTLLYLGVAQAIGPDFSLFDFASWAALSGAEHAGHPLIHTVSRVLLVPQVIMLQLYDRLPHTKVRFSRLNIYIRDESRCQYCGETAARAQLNLDHVVPRSRGGKTTWENVVCCCVPCNLKKGARTPQEAGMRLLRQPARPRLAPGFVRPQGPTPHAWLPFLGTASASYWNTELIED